MPSQYQALNDASRLAHAALTGTTPDRPGEPTDPPPCDVQMLDIDDDHRRRLLRRTLEADSLFDAPSRELVIDLDRTLALVGGSAADGETILGAAVDALREGPTKPMALPSLPCGTPRRGDGLSKMLDAAAEAADRVWVRTLRRAYVRKDAS